MKTLKEGASVVTALFLILTTAISFFFAVQRHRDKTEIRHAKEKERTKYEQELFEAQEQMRHEHEEYMRRHGIEPTQDYFPQQESKYEDFYFRDR